MKSIYQAAHGVDAHMIRALLEQAGIPAQVRGEYLQGALGELPVSGMVAVWVPEADAARAKELVLDWEQSVPEEDMDDEQDAGGAGEVRQPRPRGRAKALVAALLLVPVLWWAAVRILG
ncbi:MAG: DUF2007 domain-containing protein, partial [Gammaproteobacteria bacterium]|nr:DUF2007 domain-containing protein [Gammaproteobacteria bacterium]